MAPEIRNSGTSFVDGSPSNLHSLHLFDTARQSFSVEAELDQVQRMQLVPEEREA